MKRALSTAQRNQLGTLRGEVEAGRLTAPQAALKLRWRMQPDDGPQSVQELLANPTDALKNMFRASLIHRIGDDQVRALDELVAELAARHDIEDRFRLERAVDTALLIYHGHRGVMDNSDIERLLEHLPKAIEVLGRGENGRRLADMFMDRDRNLIDGATWNMKEATDITMRFMRIKDELVDILGILQRPRRREGDLKSHATFKSLERYWASLPGKKCAAAFAPDGSPKSEMLRFIWSVMNFIDRGAAKKLANLSRGRLRGVTKRRA
jgi:hypothetical protein